MKQAKKEIGDLLKELREGFGISLEEAVIQIDCEERELRRIEAGDRIPSEEKFERLMDFYLDAGMDSLSADLFRTCSTLIRRCSRNYQRFLKLQKEEEERFQSRELVFGFYDALRYGRDCAALGHLDEIRNRLSGSQLDFVYRASRLAYGLIHVRENEDRGFLRNQTDKSYDADACIPPVPVVRETEASGESAFFGQSRAARNRDVLRGYREKDVRKNTEQNYIDAICGLLSKRWKNFDGEHLPQGSPYISSGMELFHSDIILFNILSLSYFNGSDEKKHMEGVQIAWELYEFLKNRENLNWRDILDEKAVCFNLACMAFRSGHYEETRELLKHCRQLHLPGYGVDSAMHLHEKRLEVELECRQKNWPAPVREQKLREIYHNIPTEQRPLLRMSDFLNSTPEIWLF